MSRHFKLQQQQTGFYQPPNHADWGSEDFWNFFMENNESLDVFAKKFAEDTSDHFTNVILTLNTQSNKYFDEMRLRDHSFWISNCKKPFELAQHLRIYANMRDKLCDILHNAYETTFECYKSLLLDHTRLLEYIIRR